MGGRAIYIGVSRAYAYAQEAAKIQQESPEHFEQVKSGEILPHKSLSSRKITALNSKFRIERYVLTALR
tara:strand:+ start:307 stop:513 length:207 start_codon:yes stop_codon:yes gene_type:complete